MPADHCIRSEYFKLNIHSHTRDLLLIVCIGALMESIGKECTPLKKEYDDCFNKWYSEKFLKGDTAPDCNDLFLKYRDCVMVYLAILRNQKVLKERKLDTMIDDARKDINSRKHN